MTNARAQTGSPPAPFPALGAELLDELAGAQLFAADTRSTCLRRAERLLRLADHASGRARAALLVVRRSVLLVAEAAEGLLEDLAGDLGALVENDVNHQQGAER